ncbi:MAG: hypothetical protein ABW136_11755 [Steroidobacteraceae bacterium]
MNPFVRLLGIAVLPWILTGCASSGLAREGAPDCQALVGKYDDGGRIEGVESPESLASLLDLDTSLLEGSGNADWVVAVRRSSAGAYYLGIERKDAPPTDSAVWETPVRCVADELQFDTKARYQSPDGVRVTRQQLKLALYSDEDGTLILQREFKVRSLGLVDVRSGGPRAQYYRFTKRSQ